MADSSGSKCSDAERTLVPDELLAEAGGERRFPGVQMSYKHLRFFQLWAAEYDAAGVSIEDKGRGHFQLVAWDKSNMEIARRTVGPNDLSLPD